MSPSINKKIIIIILILFVIILGGVFYWFELRPVQIRKNCYDSVITNPFKTEAEQRSDFNYMYQDCLKMKGLEK